MAKTQLCPLCEGEGRYEGFRDKWSDTHGHYTEPVMLDCEVCSGTGEIPSPEQFVLAQFELLQENADYLETTPEAVDTILNQLLTSWRKND